MALKRVWIPSPNYSARRADVRIVVLHTAEGARTYQSLGNFFASSRAQVSSHVGIDDTPGTIGEYVKPADKAWTCAAYNPVAIQAELCGFASWTPADHQTMLQNTAAWIAEECARYGLPIVKLTPAQARVGGRGVCQHSDLGAGGGGHWDCGPNFPIDDVIAMAKGGTAASTPTPQPPKPPTEEEIVSIATGTNSAGALHVFVEAKDGSVWYTWQRKGETGWEGGKAGASTAQLQPFAPAPK
jgi:hypothetical protein